MRPSGQVVSPSCFSLSQHADSLSKHAGLFRGVGGGRRFSFGVGGSLGPLGMEMSQVSAILTDRKTERNIHIQLGNGFGLYIRPVGVLEAETLSAQSRCFGALVAYLRAGKKGNGPDCS